MGKRPRVFEILPSVWFLGLIVLVIGGAGLFVSTAMITEDVKRDVYVLYSVDDSGAWYGFVALDADGTKTSGFRDPQYPMAVIRIKTAKRVFAPLRRGRRVSIATLSRSRSFKVRITDGSNGDRNGQYWDYPSIDEQLAEQSSRQPSRDVSEITGSIDDEFNEIIKRILSGVPERGEPIAEPRRTELVRLTLGALGESGYQEAVAAIQKQQSSYSQVVWSGWLKLGGFAAFVVVLTGLFSLVSNASKKA